MIVAMVSMRMVQMAFDQVIDMIAVGHCFVAAIGTVNVAFGVPTDVMVDGAFVRMRGVHLDHMFFNLGAFLMHQVTAFEIIRVSMMFNRRVPATGMMLMIF